LSLRKFYEVWVKYFPYVKVREYKAVCGNECTKTIIFYFKFEFLS